MNSTKDAECSFLKVLVYEFKACTELSDSIVFNAFNHYMTIM